MNAIHDQMTPQLSSAMQQAYDLVSSMGELVKRQVEDALDALKTGDVDKAKVVASSDAKVNNMELSADKECTSILALHQPVAGDLRMVIVLLKAVTDLERIGDEAGHIAEQALLVKSTDYPRQWIENVAALGEKVISSLAQLMDNFAQLKVGMGKMDVDIDSSWQLVDKDETINKRSDALIEEILKGGWGEASNNPQVCMSLIWCVRSLERVGDHVKNISQYLIYLAEGTDIRHNKGAGRLVEIA